jgi:triphosphoribosyl-dephospho-CoA synthase
MISGKGATTTMREIPQHVSKCLQLALLLEVSAYPKPGNVHRTADFKGTKYEHFLASAVALAPHFAHCAALGMAVHNEKLRLDEIEVGKTIKKAVNDVTLWQHGGNTVLGSTILLMPMAAAAGITFAEGKFSVHRLRRHIKTIIESTNSDDAVNLYEAIGMVKPGGLGTAPELDVTQTSSTTEIKKRRVSLHQVFKISAPWDSISSEWVNNYHITFDIGYPFLTQQLKETEDINTATVNTFLKILSEVPDSLIARKIGKPKAEEVSDRAKKVLENGGFTTNKGKESLIQFDKQLRIKTHKLNPGTTADITSAVLAIAILNGYRP